LTTALSCWLRDVNGGPILKRESSMSESDMHKGYCSFVRNNRTPTRGTCIGKLGCILKNKPN